MSHSAESGRLEKPAKQHALTEKSSNPIPASLLPEDSRNHNNTKFICAKNGLDETASV